MHKILLAVGLVGLLIFPKLSVSQNLSQGWNFIKNNDFRSAHAAFEANLKQNASNEDALIGLLFLAETVQNQELYQKTANQLLAASGWKPQFVALFGQMFEDDAAIVARLDLPENLRAAFAFGAADSLFVHRKFLESNQARATIISDFNWAIAGPFTNVSGAGFIEPTAVETTNFDLKQRFLNEEGREFGWLPLALRAPDGIVRFNDLPPTYALATFYANTFLTVPTARKAQFRISRRSPMKLWLDGQLVADFPKPTAYRWDLEVVSLDLAAGSHRILVKYSQFPQNGADQKLALDFNDRQNDGDGDYENYDYNFSQSSLGDSEFALRVTDETGHVFRDLTSDFEGQFQPAAEPISTKTTAREWLTFFQKEAEANGAARPAAYYLFAKICLKYEEEEAGEAFFAQKLAENPHSAYLKFLVAKFFHQNGKAEKAEALLSELDTTACPTFAWQLKKLNELDPAQKEKAYLACLENMLKISPTNWPTMRRYLEFLKEKGRREVIEPFVKSVLAERGKDEKWHRRLDDYLKDDSYKPQSFKEKTDKIREKEYKSAQNRLKKRFDETDYATVVEFLKQKDKNAEVLSTYDEILAAEPWATGWLREKAAFLFEKNRLDEALEICNRLVVFEPYSASLCELMGDIFLEKKDKPTALDFYKKAKKLGGQYDGYGLAEKIERLENKRKFNHFFEPFSFEEETRDTAWRADFQDEESIISRFSTEMWLNDDNQIETTRRMVVQILSAEGAKFWTEGDFRLLGNVTSARVVKPNGSTTSPDMSGGVAVFKNLAAGDRIEIEGSTQQPLPDDIAGEFLWFEVLPFRVPVAKSTLEILVPQDTTLYFSSNRLVCKPVVNTVGGFQKFSFSWKNLPKVDENESAVPENLDRYPFLMVGSAEDWSSVVRWYLRKTYRRTEPNYEVLEKMHQLISPEMSDETKVARLYEFVTKEVKYSFVPFLNSNYTPRRPSETISGSIGDCKDVATLMISMLREAGFQAWHVLVSTHNFSNKEPRPTIYVFNHAIVAYELSDGVLRFLDLTTDYFPLETLPEQDNGAWGLVIRDGETRLRRLPNDAILPEKSQISLKTRAVVGSDRSISMEVENSSRGVVAGKMREMLNPKTEAERRKFLADYYGGGSLTNVSFEKIEFDSLENLAAPLHSRLKMRAFNQVDKVSNFHIVPLPLPLSMPTLRELFAEKRYNDLDLNALFELAPIRETVDVVLPDEFEFMEIPTPIWRQNEFGDFSLKFEKRPDGSLRIQRDLTWKQRFVRHEDFEKFKAFYLDLADADGTKLALKTKIAAPKKKENVAPPGRKSPEKTKANEPLKWEKIVGKRI